MECENIQCDVIHDGSFGTGRFCSRSCANRRSWTDEDKLNKSKAALASEKVHNANKVDGIRRRKIRRIILKECPICHKEFDAFHYDREKREKTYCSKQCFMDDTHAKYRKTNEGGYRKGSGRGKSGRYASVWCDSSYELCYLIYCIEHGIPIERNKQKYPYVDMDGKHRTYLPDFLVGADKDIIEIKGFKERNFYIKINACPGVIVFFKKDIQYCFEYVENKYGKNFIELYE